MGKLHTHSVSFVPMNLITLHPFLWGEEVPFELELTSDKTIQLKIPLRDP